MQKTKVFTQHFDRFQDTWEDHRDTEHKSAFDAFTHIAKHFAHQGVEQITVTVTDQDQERVQMFFEGTDTGIEITIFK